MKTAAKTPQYKVGDVVTYTTFSGQPRTITVADRSDNIKNGRPGFDGDDDNGNTYWGYDSDVTDVQSGKSKKIPKAKSEGKTENAFRAAVAELRGLIGEQKNADPREREHKKWLPDGAQNIQATTYADAGVIVYTYEPEGDPGAASSVAFDIGADKVKALWHSRLKSIELRDKDVQRELARMRKLAKQYDLRGSR